MRICGVLAVSENDVIGAGNKLPWRISNDLKWFKRNTMGKPMIMGRKTFDSLPGLLPDRTSIILTRDTGFHPEKALVAHSLEQALELAKEDAKTRQADEICIVGGSEIFNLFLPLIDRFYLTRVHISLSGDTFFSSLVEQEWKIVFSEHHDRSEKDEYPHTFYILDRN